MRRAGRRDWALRGVDLRIEPGERVLLLGRSGSGKSTLLASLAGLLDPSATETEGELLVDGLTPRAAADRTGILFQDAESQLVMGSAGDDVAFGLENRCVPTSEMPARVAEALAAAGFPYGPDRSTDALSGGERQRLALAGTLALRPGLLLLDEPTANLDPDAAAAIRSVLLRTLAARDTTLVVVEHRVEEWLPIVDRVIVLAGGGGVLVDGPPARLFAEDLDLLKSAGVWIPGESGAHAARPSAPTAEALLLAEGTTFRYPGEAADAVGPLDIELLSAEAVAVTGPNGSGKSTLALLLGGLLAPRAGTVLATPALVGDLAGRPLAEWSAAELVRHVGSVFQDPEHQFLTGSVRDELMLGPRRADLGEAEASRRADDLLARMRLTQLAAANPFTLSGGEKRRLSVATALATEPRLLILDEPTFGQDALDWAELRDLLLALRDEGTGLCFVTHDTAFVAAVADRTVNLDGRLGCAS